MTLPELAQAIDTATDSGDVESLRYLSKECEKKLETATSEERVALLYYQSNTHYGIFIISRRHEMTISGTGSNLSPLRVFCCFDDP